jgi:long-chain fatty acid transport protein
LDWNSILTFHIGVQRELNSFMKVRLGYVFNENPINDETLFFTVGAPPLFQHVFGGGATLQLTPNIAMNFAYGHAFRNTAESPWYGAAGPIPGTNLRIAHEADAFLGGLTVYY